MGKYDGVRVVSSGSDYARTKKKGGANSLLKGGYLSGFLTRAVCAALLLCALFSVKFIPHPIVEEVLGTIKTAVTFDLNPSGSDMPGAPLIEMIKKLFE